MSQYLLATKFQPSLPNTARVQRAGLIELLRQTTQCRLRVIHASAGYGKTSLLAQWFDTLRADGCAAAWLSVDADDNHAETFVAYLIVAVERSGAPLQVMRSVAGDGLRDVPPKSALILLINDLVDFGQPVHIILDEYEAINNEEVDALLNFLVTKAPDNVRFTIAGRMVPSLNLADLAVKNDVLTLTAADLRMDIEEASQLLAGEAERLTTDDVAMLVSRTEGWPIALKLANLSLGGHRDSKSSIENFSGRVAELADYLTEQVFASQSPDTQKFLLYTSILSRVNGDLANALCQRSDGWDVLVRLEREDLLIHAVDGERRWYRYHKLFEEFLRASLERKHRAKLPALHKLASDWHLELGQLSEAIRHAHQAGDTRAVADRIEAEGGWLLYLRGRIALMELVDEKLNTEDIDRHLRLCLLRIYVCLKRSEFTEAREAYERLQRRTGDFTQWLNEPLDEAARGEIELVRFLLLGYEDRVFHEADIERAERLCVAMANHEPLTQAAAHNVACLLYLQSGNLNRCMSAGNKAIASFRKVNALYMESFIYFHQAKALLMQGKLRDAEMLFAQNDDLIVRHFGTESDFVLIESAYRSELFYLRNEIREAEQSAAVPLARVGKFDAWFDVYNTAFLVAAAAARSRDGLDSASVILDRAEEFATEIGMPRLSAFAGVQRLNNAIWAGDRSAANDLAGALDVHGACERYANADISSRRIYVAHRLALARLALLNAVPDEADRHLELLDHMLALTGSRYGALQPMLLRAIACKQRDEDDEAFALIDEAISAALFDGCLRPFIDAGDLIHPLLSSYGERSQSAGSNRLRDIFLREIMHSLESEQRMRQRASSVLTPRQLEVLRQARAGYSNKEIARRIRVGENTIKFHLKNINRILETPTRQAAVAEAVRRNLI